MIGGFEGGSEGGADGGSTRAVVMESGVDITGGGGGGGGGVASTLDGK